MDDSKDKVDPKKIERATEVLKEIMDQVAKFDEIFKTLTIQEKYLTGGIIFRIRSIWSDFSLVGIMADREFAKEMIDTIVTFYQNPGSFKGLRNEPGSTIKPANDSDDFSN